LNQQPNNSVWWMGLAIARESLRKNKEAVEAYTKASNTDNLSSELKVYAENRIHALL
jgi:MSHA biogenesis protein MshN